MMMMLVVLGRRRLTGLRNWRASTLLRISHLSVFFNWFTAKLTQKCVHLGGNTPYCLEINPWQLEQTRMLRWILAIALNQGVLHELRSVADYLRATQNCWRSNDSKKSIPRLGDTVMRNASWNQLGIFVS